MSYIKEFKSALISWKRKRRLKKILKACKIAFPLHEWQERFILDETPSFPYAAMERRTGKTMTVILRAMVWDVPLGKALMQELMRDPDAGGSAARKRLMLEEYKKYAMACARNGIKFRWTNITRADFNWMLYSSTRTSAR